MGSKISEWLVYEIPSIDRRPLFFSSASDPTQAAQESDGRGRGDEIGHRVLSRKYQSVELMESGVGDRPNDHAGEA